MKYTIGCASDNGSCVMDNEKIVFTAEKNCEQAFFDMKITFPDLKDDCYIMMPACAYNGNKFRRVDRTYPPKYQKDEAGVDCEPLMTNVPALNPDGSGQIQVTTGDMATPCVGIFNRALKKSFFLLTEQEIKGKNLGFTVESGSITISFPANRTDIYKSCQPHLTSGDTGISVAANEKLTAKYKIFTFDCNNIPEFYKQFFKIRKALMSSKRADFLYTKELWDIMENHFNHSNWHGEYYAEITKKWQCGWTGGGMSTYPLLKYGKELSKQRARATLDYMTSHQAPSGFYYGLIKDGVITDDSNNTPGMEGLHLIRKSGDALYFLFKNFTATIPKKEWVESAKRCADAFVKLYEKYETFGHFVHNDTGNIMVGGSFSGAIVPAALAKAWEFFGDKKYLEIAEKSLEKYYEIFAKTGITNGGPGEILGAPDSESAFGFLESLVVLYELTKNKKWLDYAETAAMYCSSWVVTYAYKFPAESEFNRLKINTVGSVFANVQNKHSSPGICTASGDALLKLYRYTKKEEYLELIKDIAYFIPQCVSTEKRPIYSWHKEPQKLPSGYICERVNMSDWESYGCIGGVFNCSCWCETSLILSFAELMTIDEMLPETGK